MAAVPCGSTSLCTCYSKGPSKNKECYSNGISINYYYVLIVDTYVMLMPSYLDLILTTMSANFGSKMVVSSPINETIKNGARN